MRKFEKIIALTAIGFTATITIAQEKPKTEGARELYYLSTGPKDSLPSVRRTAAPAKSAEFAAMHLGLRYGLWLVNDSRPSSQISSDQILHAGDCFAIELEANRSGYLYVLVKQSSGTWRPVLPSADLPDESSVIDPGKKVRIPKKNCYAISNPPGTETLFVVLSRDPRDFYSLYAGIQAQNTDKTPAPEGPSAAPKRSEGAQLAGLQVNQSVKQLTEAFGTRDIAIKKMTEPASPGGNSAGNKSESQNSVYVVNTSAKPVSSIVTKIEIRHR